MSPSFLFSQFMGGLTTAMFLFLIASGLSLRAFAKTFASTSARALPRIRDLEMMTIRVVLLKGRCLERNHPATVLRANCIIDRVRRCKVPSDLKSAWFG